MYAMAGFITAMMMSVTYMFFWSGPTDQTEPEKSREGIQQLLYTFRHDMNRGQQVLQEDIEAHLLEINKKDNIRFPGEEDILGKILGRDVTGGTLVDDSILRSALNVPEGLRLQMYSGIEMNSEILEGSYIDIRIQFADGEDFIVASCKKVEKRGEDSLFIFVDEEEILRLSSALTDLRWYEGTRLYGSLYADEEQQPASPDYPVNGCVTGLSDWTPNLSDHVCLGELSEKRKVLEENLRQLRQ